MFDFALHRWMDRNYAKLTSSIRAKAHVNFPRSLSGVPTTNYVETAADIRAWVNQTYPDTLEWEYDL